uniref:NIDO domain-containing protein n=1 Tax=Amphimedon queenslandica TaxID=400682 RepID=A0A1X7ULZ7_AMPQE
MMIVLVILIYFNGLLVSSESNYLPFLYPTDYMRITMNDYSFDEILLPSLLKFGSRCYSCAKITTDGYVAFGYFYHSKFSYIAPYRDGTDLNKGGEVRFATIFPSKDPSIFRQVNSYLSNSTGSSVSAEWILWTEWYEICPSINQSCHSNQTNHFQVVLAYQSNATYAVFIYKCGLIRWTKYRAFVGIFNHFNTYDNSGYTSVHPLSNTDNVTDIDCYDVVSGWTNIVYRLDQGQLVLKGFRIVSITYDSIIVSWEVYPNDNTILSLNVADSQQTVNKTINVAGYNNVYTHNGEVYMCNVYTFKLTLPTEKTGCNENIKVISIALTPKPENVSALYLTNEILTIRFQIQQCFINKVQLILFEANGHINTSDPLDINSLQYIDEFYIIHWNIKLNDHSLYYLTVSAIGTYGTSTSDHVTEINTYNVKDIIIKRNENIVCFTCVTEVFNECQLMITTLIPQSIQTNGTCYSFTDNGTYTVYAHDIENGIKILTPAIVIEYIVDWIKPVLQMIPSHTETTSSAVKSLNITNEDNESSNYINQSYTSVILGGLFAFSTCIVLILLIVLLVILRKKVGNNTKSQDIYDIPIKSEANSAHKMKRLNSEIATSQNCSYSGTTNICDTPIYDDIA